MQLTNTTSIPDSTIRELIRFAKPSGVANFDVMVKNSGGSALQGRAYTKGSRYHYSNRPFVLLRMPKKTDYPNKWVGFGGYLSHTSLNLEEDVLLVLAHELRHLWQKQHPRGWRVWGARGVYSERDADAFAIGRVRAYRRQVLEQVPVSEIMFYV
jgi:hypothetical protein